MLIARHWSKKTKSIFTMGASDLYKIPILWHRFWLFPWTSALKPKLFYTWQNPGSSHFKKGMQASKRTFFESVWIQRQVSKDTDDYVPKLWKNITGNLSKTKLSKNLVFYLSMTVEALAEPQANSSGWVCSCSLKLYLLGCSWTLHLDLSSHFFKGTGIPKTKKTIFFHDRAAFQSVHPASQSRVTAQRLLPISKCLFQDSPFHIPDYSSFTPNSNPKYSNSGATFQIITLKHHNSVELTTTRISEPNNS